MLAARSGYRFDDETADGEVRRSAANEEHELLGATHDYEGPGHATAERQAGLARVAVFGGSSRDFDAAVYDERTVDERTVERVDVYVR